MRAIDCYRNKDNLAAALRWTAVVMVLGVLTFGCASDGDGDSDPQAEPEGASTPEEAVRRYVEAAVALDRETFIRVVDPDLRGQHENMFPTGHQSGGAELRDLTVKTSSEEGDWAEVTVTGKLRIGGEEQALDGTIIVRRIASRWFVSDGEVRDLSASVQVGVEALVAERAAFPYDLADGQTVGGAAAPREVIVFCDFQAPCCLRYVAEIEFALIEEFVGNGRVRLIARHLPILGPESSAAAIAAVCAADQDRFWPMYHELYLTQARAGQAEREEINVGRFSDVALSGIAELSGLNVDDFQACATSGEATAHIAADKAAADAAGIRSVPAILIDGELVGTGAPPLDEFRELLQ